MMLWILSLVPALLPTLLNSQVHGVCAACRQALETSGQTGLARGLGWSVVILLSAPALMVSAFIYMVVRSMRRTAKANLPVDFTAPDERP